MIVYHGSDLELKNPSLDYGRYNLDFGKGFYVTTLKDQAEKWAARRAVIKHKTPVISLYEFDIEQLSVLSFSGYTEEWLDFIVKNRAGKMKSHEYDAIYGNIANDDVATVVNDYMRLLNMGRISSSGKQFFLEQLQYSKPNNQYCIATEKGLTKLIFTKSYSIEE